MPPGVGLGTVLFDQRGYRQKCISGGGVSQWGTISREGWLLTAQYKEAYYLRRWFIFAYPLKDILPRKTMNFCSSSSSKHLFMP